MIKLSVVLYISIGVIVVAGIIILVMANKEGYCYECARGVGTDHLTDKHPSTHASLLPILTPEFNFRETAKQLLLLEDHLFNYGKRCNDCIRKHFLTAEALMEESISLDKERKYEDMCKRIQIPNKLRELQREFENGGDLKAIAQECRKIRKPLHTSFFSSF